MTGELHIGGTTGARREPLAAVMDTDIGTDIDDAYALLLAISSPELKIGGITLVHGDVGLRAKIAFKLLSFAGRTGIPVVPGEERPMNRERPVYWAGHEGRGIDFSHVAEVRVAGETASEFIARAASESPGRITLITVGPMTNVGVAISDFPKEMTLLRGIVSMGSTFNGFGAENAGVEHNIKCDPEAAAIVLGSGIPITLVGLNVTMKTALSREHVAQISAVRGPLARYMAHMTEDWLSAIGRHRTPMHDPLAVVAAFDPAVVHTVPVTAEVSRETAGQVTYFEGTDGCPLRVCDAVDVLRFEDVFFSRVLSAVGAGGG